MSCGVCGGALEEIHGDVLACRVCGTGWTRGLQMICKPCMQGRCIDCERRLGEPCTHKHDHVHDELGHPLAYGL